MVSFPLQVPVWTVHHHVDQSLTSACCDLFIWSSDSAALIYSNSCCAEEGLLWTLWRWLVQQLVISAESRTCCSGMLHHQISCINLACWSVTSWRPALRTFSFQTSLLSMTATLENRSITSCLSTPWLQTSETDSSSSSYCQTDFLS